MNSDLRLVSSARIFACEVKCKMLRPCTTDISSPAINERIVGKPEVILGPDLFGGQVVNALLYCVGLSETDALPNFR